MRILILALVSVGLVILALLALFTALVMGWVAWMLLSIIAEIVVYMFGG